MSELNSPSVLPRGTCLIDDQSLWFLIGTATVILAVVFEISASRIVKCSCMGKYVWFTSKATSPPGECAAALVIGLYASCLVIVWDADGVVSSHSKLELLIFLLRWLQMRLIIISWLLSSRSHKHATTQIIGVCWAATSWSNTTIWLIETNDRSR